MKDSRKIFTTKELADYLGVHVKTIRTWVKAGKIKEMNLGYRTKRYSLESL